jgi:ribonuclease P protein component
VQRVYSLKRGGQFQYVYHRGQRASCKELSLLYSRSGKLLVGFSVSRKVGNAVARNLMKRRLREIIRPCLPRMRAGLYVIVIKEPAVGVEFSVLKARMIWLLNKQRLFLGQASADIRRNTPPEQQR